MAITKAPQRLTTFPKFRTLEKLGSVSAIAFAIIAWLLLSKI
ncbi:MAG: hypothetical protein K0Q66_1281 [Chitinophagaceae bacterium]|nr:hypothetical protein [Chitinophagaceae bacterium]